MTKSQIYRLYCYRAFGYKYVDEGFLLEDYDIWFDDLDKLKKELKFCNLCELCKTRNNVLVPSGNENAKIMIVFESPGFSADKNATAYNGQLGEKFFEIFEEVVGVSVKECYTTFLMKCRIPQNRKIDRNLLLKCAPYLSDEIRILKPKAVLSFGELCAKVLLRNDNLPSLDIIHGSLFKDSGITYIPTFGVNFLLSNPSRIDDFKSDLEKIKQFL
ncbi:MAG: uracil-DNA glycosylase [Campylobacter sp.]|nr:uracil-DNA glycosylase [Campylobacter sp.]MBO7476072.1 uracil-DNA glycosylase [Campylobacter sp.]